MPSPILLDRAAPAVPCPSAPLRTSPAMPDPACLALPDLSWPEHAYDACRSRPRQVRPAPARLPVRALPFLSPTCPAGARRACLSTQVLAVLAQPLPDTPSVACLALADPGHFRPHLSPAGLISPAMPVPSLSPPVLAWRRACRCKPGLSRPCLPCLSWLVRASPNEPGLPILPIRAVPFRGFPRLPVHAWCRHAVTGLACLSASTAPLSRPACRGLPRPNRACRATPFPA